MQLATVPPFWQVPVTPAGMLPLASYPTDLVGPPKSDVGSSPVPRHSRYPAAGQSYLVMINRVYASSSFTSIAWTIQSRRVRVAASQSARIHRSPMLSRRHRLATRLGRGPQIQLGSPLCCELVWMTSKLAGRGALECVCTDLRIGAASLRAHGRSR